MIKFFLIAFSILLLPIQGFGEGLKVSSKELQGAYDNPFPVVKRIAYGSCIHQNHKQPIWRAVNEAQPELFVFLGDNIYGDTRDMSLLADKYQKLGANPGFQDLKAQTPIVATWDDHDYGENDAGKDYPFKEESRQIMLDFFEEPADSLRRSRSSGIYTSYYFGEGDTSLQLILLDLRWNRTKPKEQNPIMFYLTSFLASKGPYEPNWDDDASLLGADQWKWLEAELQKSAKVRIVASSLQLLPEDSGWEAWASFPREREKLFSLIAEHKVEGVFFISGDTHWSEFSKVKTDSNYPFWELTSSGLTEEWTLVSPNDHRVGDYYNEANFGLIELDWTGEAPKIRLSIKDVEGSEKMFQVLDYNSLTFH